MVGFRSIGSHLVIFSKKVKVNKSIKSKENRWLLFHLGCREIRYASPPLILRPTSLIFLYCNHFTMKSQGLNSLQTKEPQETFIFSKLLFTGHGPHKISSIPCMRNQEIGILCFRRSDGIDESHDLHWAVLVHSLEIYIKRHPLSVLPTRMHNNQFTKEN